MVLNKGLFLELEQLFRTAKELYCLDGALHINI